MTLTHTPMYRLSTSHLRFFLFHLQTVYFAFGKSEVANKIAEDDRFTGNELKQQVRAHTHTYTHTHTHTHMYVCMYTETIEHDQTYTNTHTHTHTHTRMYVCMYTETSEQGAGARGVGQVG